MCHSNPCGQTHGKSLYNTRPPRKEAKKLIIVHVEHYHIITILSSILLIRDTGRPI